MGIEDEISSLSFKLSLRVCVGGNMYIYKKVDGRIEKRNSLSRFININRCASFFLLRHMRMGFYVNLGS